MLIKPRLRAVIVLAVLAISPVARAQPSDLSVRYTILPPRQPIGEEHSAKPLEYLLSQPLFAERAARLEGEAKVRGGWARSRTIAAGTALFAAFNTGANPAAVYCAPATAKGRDMWGLFFPCFYDTDLDGAFDHVAAGQEGGPLVGVVDDGTVARLALPAKLTALPGPLRYTEIPADQGPEVQVKFRWRPVRALTGGPVNIRIWTILGRWAISDVVSAPLNEDGTATINVEGAVFTILGLGPNDTLRYRVEQAVPEHAAPVNIGQPPTTIYIYM